MKFIGNIDRLQSDSNHLCFNVKYIKADIYDIQGHRRKSNLVIEKLYLGK